MLDIHNCISMFSHVSLFMTANAFSAGTYA